jgi:alpha(1,3/1,4) fucosyltransferase
MQKKSIKVLFTGGDNIQNKKIRSILEKHFIIDSTPPHDFVVYGDYEYSYLNYDCVRLHYCVELGTVDFEMDDYVIGYDYMQFSDRYIRYPYYLFRDQSTIQELYQEHDFYSQNKLFDRDFCSYLSSNPLAYSDRDNFFKKLSSYKKVNSGGKHLNNINRIIQDKIAFLNNHKFNIAAENTIHDGITSEKIVDAFEANTIPIYIGNPLIGLEFNEDCFINCNKFDSYESLIEHIKSIDNDQSKYLEMLSKPKILANSKVPDEINLENFLVNIFSQDPKNAIRRPISQKTITKERTLMIYQLLIRERSWKVITSIIKMYSKLPIKLKKLIRSLL